MNNELLMENQTVMYNMQNFGNDFFRNSNMLKENEIDSKHLRVRK